MKDIFGRILDVWDVIAVVSANEKLELALITSTYTYPIGVYRSEPLIVPVIRRFNIDGILRKKETEFNHCETRSLLLVKDAVPYECWQSRVDYIDSLED